MARLALFAAHRYVQAGAACPRTVGVDGKPLLRPWRVASTFAVQAARAQRSCRPQPWWPRLMGAACLGVAAWFAMHPIGAHVAAMSSALPVPKPKSPIAESLGELTLTMPFRFTWQRRDAEAPFTWVLLDAGYEEIARRDGLGDSGLTPDTGVRELLGQGDTFHWFVLAKAAGKITKSNLETVRIR